MNTGVSTMRSQNIVVRGGLLLLMVALVLVVQRQSVSRVGTAQQEDHAWAAVRRTVPAAIAVWRPTWVPARFHTGYVGSSSATKGSASTDYGVAYCVADCKTGDVLQFVLNPVGQETPAQPARVTLVRLHGLVVTAATFPPVAVTWSEGGQQYAVQARGVDRAELLKIVATLKRVAPLS